MVGEPDEALVARFRAGDEAAFEALVRRYEASLRKLAFGYLRDRMLAEDVAQESLLLAYQRIGIARPCRGVPQLAVPDRDQPRPRFPAAGGAKGRDRR